MAEIEYEYGFEAPGPVPGLMYVTRNVMLAETMHAARPSSPMFVRVATPWQPVDPESSSSEGSDR